MSVHRRPHRDQHLHLTSPALLSTAMRSLKKYYTGLIPSPGEHLAKRVCGRGWQMGMARRPTKCCQSVIPKQDEIVIYAQSLSRAEAALSLFIDCLEMICGPWKVERRIVPEDDAERKKYCSGFSSDIDGSFSAGNFDIVAHLTRKASQKKRLAYAITLYAISCHNHVNDPMDLDPALFPYQYRSDVLRDQVRFAYAIIAAYAVLEQLKLTPEPQSFANGAWIPEKKLKLEAKLERAGLDMKELALWHLRGGKTRLEIQRPPKIVKMCPWSSHMIRDCEVEIVDAIADVRALRSQVAAHDVKNLARCLSVHDVANAQYLARRIILAVAGFNERKFEEIRSARRYPRRRTAIGFDRKTLIPAMQRRAIAL